VIERLSYLCTVKECTNYDVRCTICSKPIVRTRIVLHTMFAVRFLLIAAFIGLTISAFSQVTPDTTRRPKRTKTLTPTTSQDQSRRGSKIVDDSTKSVYGPTTTRWTTEREAFTAKTNFRALDTTIDNYHRWTFVQKSNNFYHDLGNNGTALNPVFPVIPSFIGATPGFNAYAPYWNAEQDLRLFDTKSPYTRMALVWGGQGRAATRVEYSRNITPKWNVTLNFRPILTDKQILRSGRADRNVISYYYDLYTHYTTKDDRYKIVAAYQRIRHRVIENGGISYTGLDPQSGDYNYKLFFDEVSPNLTRANSYEQHNKFHIFHQFNLGKVQAYHIADLETQINWYRDDLNADPAGYYDWLRPAKDLRTTDGSLLTDTTKVLDSTRFRSFQNQVGIKGQIGKKNNLFYNGWLKFRSYELWNRYMATDTLTQPGRAVEKYIGGEIQYALDSIQHITGLIEVLGGGYSRIESTGHMRWFDFQAIHRVSKPTMLQTAYSGRFDLWSNNFKAPESIYLAAFPKVPIGSFSLSPGLTYSTFLNYIYYTRVYSESTGQTVLPVQTDAPVSYATPQVSMHVQFLKKLHFRPQVLYTKVLSDRDSVLRVPTLFVNGQLTFEGDLFKHAVQVQIGIDAHWRSSYKPMAYDPVTQTFYNQDLMKPPAYLLADVFINGKIKHGRFFIKYHNVAARITKSNYMPTPFYRGVSSILDFGFELMLFD
jgi:hypothetical protein